MTATIARSSGLVVISLCIVLAGCSNGTVRKTGPAEMKSQVKSWAAAAGYESENSNISDDLTAISKGRALRDLSGLRTECEGLSADVATLYGELPTPDASLTNEFNTSLVEFGRAALTCYKLSSFDSKTYRTFSSQFREAESVYDTATHRLHTFGVG